MSPGVLLSSDGLNNSHLHTGLVGVCSVFHGVTGMGLKKACLILETWWILGIFLSGVGKITFSMPHMTIVAISCLVKKVPLLELLHATKFSMRLV